MQLLRLPTDFLDLNKVLCPSVCLSDTARGLSAALANKWDGPHELIDRSRLSNMLTNCTTRSRCGPVHVSDLKKYHPAEPTALPDDTGDPDRPRIPQVAMRQSPRYNLRRRGCTNIALFVSARDHNCDRQSILKCFFLFLPFFAFPQVLVTPTHTMLKCSFFLFLSLAYCFFYSLALALPSA